MRKLSFVSAFAVLFLLFGCSAGQQTTTQTQQPNKKQKKTKTQPEKDQLTDGTYKVADVVVKGGKLTEDEEKLLRKLDEHIVPLPDSIKLTDMSYKGRGWVKIFKPNTIYLSPKRGLHPNHTNPDYPYMMGENHAEVGTVSPQTFVLAHEMAHVLAPKLKPELGRPALGLVAGTQEIEAEIIGLVLMEIAFGSTADEFGFPDMVEYRSPNVRDKPVNRLRWQYCKIIKASFRLQTFRCNRTNQFGLDNE